MGFRTGAFANCWEIEPGRGNFTKVRLSISRKNQNGEYEQDFAGYCMFAGAAHAKAAKLKPKDRICLGDVDVCTKYDSRLKKEYIDYKVFTFTMADEVDSKGNSSSTKKHTEVDSNTVDSDPDESMPF